MKEIQKYFNIISPIPEFLNKYLSLKSLKRLENICYLCGMDYASKDIYNFSLNISRFDHSVSTALITWKYTNDKAQTIAALFHDISTPCFSHVIDYMNKDYLKQESTEEKTEEIIKSDKQLEEFLKEDGLTVDDIVDFKKYPIVDSKRPRLCADRLDGIILTSLSWTKKIDFEDIPEILDNTQVFKNEDNVCELGFQSEEIAEKVIELNELIDEACHSKEDNFMMEHLANMTRYLVEKEKISYDDLYNKDEKTLWKIFNEVAKEDKQFSVLQHTFCNIKKENIPFVELPEIKRRNINPIVNNKRMLLYS